MSIDPKIFKRYTLLSGLRPQSAASLANRVDIRRSTNGGYLRRVGDTACDTLFLLSGQVLLEDAQGRPGLHVVADDASSRDALPTGDPSAWNVRCLGNVSYLAIDSALLEVMLDWSFNGAIQVAEVTSNLEVADDDWMMRLLKKRTFQKLPPANLQAMFQRMQTFVVAAGQVLIRQGEPGDYFYVVVEGRCQVWRESALQAPLLLATYEPGECFGEESLLSGAPRSATVQTQTSARLLRLPGSDFSELLTRPLLYHLSYAQAIDQVRSGRARWLDVRMPNERTGMAPDGSIAIPAHLLRMKVKELPADTAYICVCKNGSRSAVASFVLNQAGLDAYVLEGGLSAVSAGDAEPG